METPLHAPVYSFMHNKGLVLVNVMLTHNKSNNHEVL